MISNSNFNSSKETSKNQLLIILLISYFTIFLIIIFGKLFIHPFLDYVNSDDIAYFQMAEDITNPVPVPWAYRILTPLLVNLLPFDTLTGFIIVNLSSLYATSILLYFYLRKLDFSFRISIIGVLFFLLNPMVIFLIFAICFVDLLFFFFFLLAFYALLCKNDLLFLLSVTIGVANKEVILITLILYFFYKLEEKKFLSAVKSTILISIPPITVFFLIRIIIGVNSSYFSLDTIFTVLAIHIKYFQMTIFFHPYMFYLTFGILWLISLLNYSKVNDLFLKKSAYLLPFIFLQALIASGYSRLFFIAFPIVIPISLYIFKENYSIRLLILVIIISVILVIFHFFGLLYFYKFSALSLLMSFESYLCWIVLNILFGLFTTMILTYKLFIEIQGRKKKLKI